MSIPYPDVDTVLGPLSSALDEALSGGPKLKLEEVGRVVTVGPGTALVRGFTGVKSEEVLRFPGNVMGMAFNISRKETGVVLMDPAEGVSAGDPVHRTGRVLDTPVGDACLGRVLDGLGRPLDGKGPVAAAERRPIERPAPEIMDRSPVTVPLQTGLKVVDALIPVGRGQRELILGDRQTGKTAIVLDTMMNQKETGVICIYCGVGKRGAALGRVVKGLRETGAFSYTLVVAATEEDPPGLQFAAPYTAASMAEYFMEQGRDVLVAYDDLTRHARAYRELSLLLRRPPGREAFPGDIFYVHSRLLERSTHMREEYGGGSFTALPVVETEAQNISAYIPTNIISITDGQIYLSPDLFQKGILPAVDVGESVSRVGGKTQLKVYRGVAGDLRLSYSQFEELESFSRFGARLDQETRETLDRGRRVREILKQPQGRPLRVCEQIAALVAVNKGAFDDLDLDDIDKAEKLLRERLTSEHEDLCRSIDSGEKITHEDIEVLDRLAREVVERLDKTTPSEEDHGND